MSLAYSAGRVAIALVAAGLPSASAGAAQTAVDSPFEHILAGVHFDSSVSEGPMPILDIVRKAKRHGIPVTIFTDRDHADIRYGVPFFRSLLNYTYRLPSIRKYGVGNYLSDLRAAEQRVPDALVIPGAECLPFCYWEEDFSLDALTSLNIGRVLKLRDPYKHLMAIGMEEPADYRRIPSLVTGYPIVWHLLAVRLLVAGLVFFGGLRLFIRVRVQMEAGPGSPVKLVRWLALAISFLGGALLLNSLLGPPREFDAYDRDAGSAPVQAFIDYVNSRGGMVFWAHPEVEAKVSLAGIEAYTPAYYNDLLETEDYTGFAIFWEGMRYIGRPGGIWDQVLLEYCAGKRARPVWALGELDYEEDWAPNAIAETLTVLLLRKQNGCYSHADVLDALRGGRMYAARNFYATKLRIEDFRVSTADGGRSAYSGDTFATHEPATGHLHIRALEDTDPLPLFVIRNGVQHASFELPAAKAGQELSFIFEAPSHGPGCMSFYRVLGGNLSHAVIATNPIFVRSTVAPKPRAKAEEEPAAREPKSDAAQPRRTPSPSRLPTRL